MQTRNRNVCKSLDFYPYEGILGQTDVIYHVPKWVKVQVKNGVYFEGYDENGCKKYRRLLL